MARRKKYNPERRAWRGKSYRCGRVRVRDLRERADIEAEKKGEVRGGRREE